MTDIEKIVNNALYEMYEQGTVNGSSNVTDKIVDKCLSEVKNLALLNVSNAVCDHKVRTADGMVVTFRNTCEICGKNMRAK